MNLHRSGTDPQWKKVPHSERNAFQRAGAWTWGVATPGNFISGCGAKVFAEGLHDIAKDRLWSGVAKVGVGRLLDLADGWAAEKTATKSPLGEAADVIIDKSELVFGLPVFVTKGIVPAPFAAGAVAQTAANTYYTWSAKRSGREIHTDSTGKVSTFMQWGAIGLYSIAAAIRQDNEQSEIADAVEKSAHALAFSSLAVGALSVKRYRQA